MDWATITKLDKEGRLPREEVAPLSGTSVYVVETALVTSDQHGVFVDPRAWSAVLRVVKVVQPDRFVFNGDLLDFYELSRFTKNPDVESSVDDEIHAGKRMIGDVRALLCEGQPIDVNPGNHEKRLELYLRSDAHKLAGLKMLELPNLLELHKFGATMHGYAGFKFGSARVYHGEAVRVGAGNSARQELLKWGTSGSSGHVHRLAVVPKTNDAGDFVWSESGCLCSLDPEYVTQRPDWQHGAILLFRMSDGSVRHEAVQIIDGVVQGSLGRLLDMAA